MPLLRLTIALFAWLVISFAAHCGEVEVPISKLTQEMIQRRVDQYLKEYPKSAKVIVDDRVGVKLHLKGSQIQFEKEKDVPTKLLWKYKSDTKLNPKQQQLAEITLKNFLSQALNEYSPDGKGILVVNADMIKLREKLETLQDSSIEPTNTVEKRLTELEKRVKRVDENVQILLKEAEYNRGGSKYTLYWIWHYSPCLGGWVVTGPVAVVYTDARHFPRPEPIVKTAPQGGQSTTALPHRVQNVAYKPEDEFIDDYPKDATECYRRGCIAYQDADYSIARAYFNQAVRLDAQDARFWYFKAFSELAMDRRDLALVSARRARDLQARGLPVAEQLDVAFRQRLPDSARDFLAGVIIPPPVARAVAEKR